MNWWATRWPWLLLLRFRLWGNTKRQIFLANLLGLSAKLIYADGVVAEEELRVVEQFLERSVGLSRLRTVSALSVVRKELRSPISISVFAKRYAQTFASDSAMRESMLLMLIEIACSDRKVTPQEIQQLRLVASEFQISAEQFEAFLSLGMHLAQARRVDSAHARGSNTAKSRDQPGAWNGVSRSSQEAYLLLGCSPDANLREIKQAWRKLVVEHHPDRLVAHGLPKELWEKANSHFRAIQSAYELIVRERERGKK